MPVAEFLLPDEVCKDEIIRIVNTSADASSYHFDFCDADFDGVSRVELLGNLSGLGRTLGVDIVSSQGVWYAFVTSWDQNKIYRLTFGNGLESFPTEVVDLGNPNNTLNQPVSIRIVLRFSKWYLLIHNWATASICKIEIGSDITNTSISGQTIVTAVGGFPVKLDLVDSRDELKAALMQTNGSIKIIDFKNDLDKPVLASDIVNTPVIGVSNSRDLSLVKTDGNWYAFVSGFTSAGIYRVDLGSNLMSGVVNSLVQIAGDSFQGRINNIEITESGSGYYLHVQTVEGGLFKVKLPSVTSTPPAPTITRYGQMVSYSEGYALKFVRHHGYWHGFTFQDNLGANPKLYAISTEFDCSASRKFSDDTSPFVSYSRPGTYPITLTAVSADGEESRVTKEITISESQAPRLDFEASTVCAQGSVNFNASSDQVLAKYLWSLGDSHSSTLKSPSYEYASAGNYMVTLEVESESGCKNLRQKNIKIYEQPFSDFSVPTGLLCTNNEFLFITTTHDIYEGRLSYHWYIGDSLAGTDRDLRHTFTTTGPKEIKLKTSIPGCSSETIKTTSSVQAGPVVDFSYSGVCVGETFSFHNQIEEPVESYKWQFGASDISNDPNPEFNFPGFGSYKVSLTGTNAAGCENVKAKTVNVRSRPVADFKADGPPNTCNETKTLFQNQTTTPDNSLIINWQWIFDDPHDLSAGYNEHPQHVFKDPGTYSITLTATSEFGCTAEKTKEVVILESPSTDVYHSAICHDLPVTFSIPSSQNIASYYWEIGTSYYYAPSPIHTFKTPGDFPVYLQVVGTNGCIAETTDRVHVPVPLKPDFSVMKNCVEQEATFTDITSGLDPVTARSWTFNPGGRFTGEKVGVTFQNPGNVNVALEVTTESGCTYQTTRTTSIIPRPHASFTANPTQGGYPLEVQFTNTSSGATRYTWSIADTKTQEIAPAHTFYEAGEFEVQLTAYNEQQCEHTATSAVTALAPLADADVELITLSENNDGTYRLIVTIHNKGNTYLRNLPVDIDLGGKVQLREVVQHTIAPSSKHNLVLSTDILKPDLLEYLCVSMDVSNDLSPSGNRKCMRFKEELYVFNVFPNPASEEVTVEWISVAGKQVRVALHDRMGRLMFSNQLVSVPGLNRKALRLRGMEDGVYFLLIEDGHSRQRQRIVVFNNR